MTSKFIVSLGLNDKDTCTQLHPTEECLAIVANYLAMHYDGATAYLAKGIYKMQSTGEIVLEPTIRAELFYTEREKVVDFCKWCKATFNQESVALEEVKENIDFI